MPRCQFSSRRRRWQILIVRLYCYRAVSGSAIATNFPISEFYLEVKIQNRISDCTVRKSAREHNYFFYTTIFRTSLIAPNHLLETHLCSSIRWRDCIFDVGWNIFSKQYFVQLDMPAFPSAENVKFAPGLVVYNHTIKCVVNKCCPRAVCRIR